MLCKIRLLKAASFGLTNYDISTKSAAFGELKLLRRDHDIFNYRLPIGVPQTSITLAGVKFNFTTNQANDIYVSILNDNGFPVIASILDQATGWSERQPLILSAHAAYQQCNAAPGDTFTLTVET